jgi:hypothetical protein
MSVSNPVMILAECFGAIINLLPGIQFGSSLFVICQNVSLPLVYTRTRIHKDGVVNRRIMKNAALIRVVIYSSINVGEGPSWQIVPLPKVNSIIFIAEVPCKFSLMNRG